MYNLLLVDLDLLIVPDPLGCGLRVASEGDLEHNALSLVECTHVLEPGGHVDLRGSWGIGEEKNQNIIY